MIAQGLHARAAGEALAGFGHRPQVLTLKPTTAKIAVTDQVHITLTPAITDHFTKPVRVRFNANLYPGKTVVELIPDEKNGRVFSPFRPGERRLRLKPEKIEGCGPSYPKFGSLAPEQVVIGSDGVLRLTLPKKRPPVQTKRRKMVKVQAKETTISQTPPAVSPLPSAPDKLVMRGRDTMVSLSKTRAQIGAGRELAKYLDGGRYGVTLCAMRTDGAVRMVLTRGAGHYSIGTTMIGKAKNLRSMALMNVPRGDNVPLFGPTVASEVVVEEEGKRVLLTIAPPFKSQGNRASLKTSDRERRKPATVKQQPQATAESEVPTNPLLRLRQLRDEVNSCVAAAKEEGEEITLIVKEDGKLGFRYEG